MAGDALDRLKQRARSTVPPRDAGLIEPKPNAASNPGEPIPTQQPVSPCPEAATSGLNLKANPLEPVDQRLMRLCSETKITKENFTEAAYLVCTHHPQLMQEVLQIAHQRHLAQQHEATLQQQKKAQQQPSADDLWLL